MSGQQGELADCPRVPLRISDDEIDGNLDNDSNRSDATKEQNQEKISKVKARRVQRGKGG